MTARIYRENGNKLGECRGGYETAHTGNSKSQRRRRWHCGSHAGRVTVEDMCPSERMHNFSVGCSNGERWRRRSLVDVGDKSLPRGSRRQTNSSRLYSIAVEFITDRS